ncbi:MAG: flagellar motor switch protein FliG [Betaproteobacteria bacterium]|nr:flagellar motor switch protein FliG [Betaproteobacteria bacterium]
MTEALKLELEALSSTQRAAVLMLLLGEQQASEILRYMNPKEVQALGAAMVSVADLSQEAVNFVLDDFVMTLKKQTSLGLGTTDYVEKVFKRALGEDKAASVLGRILPGQGSRGLEILQWMDARSIADMILGEHPQVIAIILSVLDYDVAADVLAFLPGGSRSEIMQRIASLETVQPSAMSELEAIMKQQFSNNSSAKSSSFGGVKSAAKIMNFVKTDLEAQIMGGLEKIDPDGFIDFDEVTAETVVGWLLQAEGVSTADEFSYVKSAVDNIRARIAELSVQMDTSLTGSSSVSGTVDSVMPPAPEPAPKEAPTDEPIVPAVPE